jgi:beta-lactamase regulating signal transducer with metallopeptidase domain
MTSAVLTPASVNLLVQLANPAARALALGAIAGLGLAAFRVKATSTRLFTWTAVLYAAIAVPMMGWILPPLPIPVPALLQQTWTIFPEKEAQSGTHVVAATATQSSPVQTAERRQNAARPERSRTGASRTNGTIVVNDSQQGERATVSWDPASTAASSRLFITPPSSSRVPWTVLAAALYLAVASFLLARFLIGLAYGRRLIRAARTIDDPLIMRKLDSRVSARIAESELISVPVTMGAFRPTILLPANWRGWDNAKIDAVLAHEHSHVARRDALTQRLSLIHRAVFWFSPLAWFLDRHLANLAEQASDEAALSCGTDRKRYARILLDFFEARHTSPGRVWWQGVSMAKAGQAEQRVERILSWKGSVAMQFKKSITVIIVALAIPVVYLAASAHPQHVPMMGAQFAEGQDSTPAQQATAPSKPQPATTPSPAIASTPDAGSDPNPQRWQSRLVLQPPPPASSEAFPP